MFERYGILVDFNFRASGHAAKELGGLITEMNKFPQSAKNIQNALHRSVFQELQKTRDLLKDPNLKNVLFQDVKGGKTGGLLSKLLYGSGVDGPAGMVRELRTARLSIQSEITKLQQSSLKFGNQLGKSDMGQAIGLRNKADIGHLEKLQTKLGLISDGALSMSKNVKLARDGVDLLGRSTSNMNALLGRTAVAMLVFYRMNQLVRTSIEGYRALEDQIASTQAILQDTPYLDQGGISNFTQLTEDVKKLGVELGATSDEVATSLNTIFQATDITTRQALEISKLATQTAVVTRSSVETITEILVGARNAFNLPASDMVEVSNKLILLWDEGVVTLDELSSAMGRVFQAGRLFGAQGQQDMAMLFTWTAAVTKESGSALRNLTYLQNVMGDLSRPNVRAKLTEAGIDFNTGNTRFESNQNALYQILERDPEFINVNFAKQRTRQGFAVLKGEYDRGYLAEGAERFTNSAGYLENAFDIVSSKPSHQLRRMQSLIDGINKSVGRDLVASFLGVADAVLAVNEALDKIEIDVTGKTVLGGVGRAAVETGGLYGAASTGMLILSMLTGNQQVRRLGANPATRFGQGIVGLGSSVLGQGIMSSRLNERNQILNALTQTKGMSAFARNQALVGEEALLPYFYGQGMTPTNVSDIQKTSPRISGIESVYQTKKPGLYQARYAGSKYKSFINKQTYDEFKLYDKASRPLNKAAAGANAAAAGTAAFAGAIGILGTGLLVGMAGMTIYNAWLDGVAQKSENARRNLEDLTDQMVQLIELPERAYQAKKYSQDTNNLTGIRSFLASEIGALPEKDRDIFLKTHGLSLFDTKIGPQVDYNILGREGVTSNKSFDEIVAALSATQLSAIAEKYEANAPIKVREDLRGLTSRGKIWTTLKGLHTGRDRDYTEDLNEGVFDWLNTVVGDDVGLMAGLGGARVWHPDKQKELVDYLNDIYDSVQAQAEEEEDIAKTVKELNEAYKKIEAEISKIEEGEIAQEWRSTLDALRKVDKEIEQQLAWEIEIGTLTKDKVEERRFQLKEEKKLPFAFKIRVGLESEYSDTIQKQLDNNKELLTLLEKDVDIEADRNRVKLETLEREKNIAKHLTRIEGYLIEFSASSQNRFNQANQTYGNLGLGALQADQTYLSGSGALINSLIGLYGPDKGNSILQSAAGLGIEGLQLQALRANLSRAAVAYNTTSAGVSSNLSNLDLLPSIYDLAGAGSFTADKDLQSVADAVSAIITSSGLDSPQASQVISMLLGAVSSNQLKPDSQGNLRYGLQAGFDTSILTKLGLPETLFPGGLTLSASKASFLQDLSGQYGALGLSGLSAMGTANANLSGAAQQYSKGLLNNLVSVLGFATSKKRSSFTQAEINELAAFEQTISPFLGQFGDIFGTLSAWQAAGADQSLLTGAYGRQIAEGQALVATPEGKVLQDFFGAVSQAGIAPSELLTGGATDTQLGVLFQSLHESMLQTMIEHGEQSLTDLQKISDSQREQVTAWEALNTSVDAANTILENMPSVSQQLMTNMAVFSAKIAAMGARLGIDTISTPWVDSVLDAPLGADMNTVNPADLLTQGGSAGTDLFGGPLPLKSSTTKQTLNKTRQTSG